MKKILLFFKPVISFLFLRNAERLSRSVSWSTGKSLSGMVSEFNFWHKFIFAHFFDRVQVLPSDVEKIKAIPGPVVFVMKNRGQLEYRYFNQLFLKENLPLIHFANQCLTLFWWPFAGAVRLMLSELKSLYDGESPSLSLAQSLKNQLSAGRHVLLNLTISRDYLFGLIKTDPSSVLSPLLQIQEDSTTAINVVTLQFLYDKHPDKTEKSYFDLLFGEKSHPGAIRKLLLFIMNYHRSPQVKFGRVIDLQAFMSSSVVTNVDELGAEFLSLIEEDLSIEKARITGPRLKTRESVIDDIMNEPSFMAKVTEFAGDGAKKLAKAKKDAQRYLVEIAADVNYSYVHFAHITLSYLWNNIFDGVVVKHDQLARVREVAGKNPVVLVPMHRSHIDYLLISDLFYQHNITFPYVCAGINMNFWPVGRFVRKIGGFFIRRSFEGNILYKETFYAYIKKLVELGHSIEFYIEGTRSRTGKLLKPKMGVLSLIMRSFFEKACDDIIFVPIAVIYDNIPEQKAYQSEMHGAEKKKENAGELIKASQVIKKKYGKVYIEFAEPISLKDYCAERAVTAKPIDDMRKEVSDFAYHLTYHINRVALVTPVAMVSLAILSMKKKTFEFEELLSRVAVLKDYLDFKNVTYSDLINYSDRYAYTEALKRLCERHILRQVDSFEGRFYHIDDTRRVELDYYKNNILHFFVSLTCFLKVLRSTPAVQISIDDAVKTFEKMKTYFRHDFTFSERRSVRDHLLKVVSYCKGLGLIDFDGAVISKTITPQNQASYDVFATLLDNFLESHLIGLKYLRHHQIENVDLKTLIKDVLVKAQPMYLKGDLSCPEAMSRFNLENSFKLFTDLGIVSTRVGDKSKPLYTVTGDTDMMDRWIESIRVLILSTPVTHSAVSVGGETRQVGLH